MDCLLLLENLEGFLASALSNDTRRSPLNRISDGRVVWDKLIITAAAVTLLRLYKRARLLLYIKPFFFFSLSLSLSIELYSYILQLV